MENKERKTEKNKDAVANAMKDTRKRRSSMRKSRNCEDEEITQQFEGRKPARRVSFASSNFVKPFMIHDEEGTVWDNTYEETVAEPSSEQSSAKSQNKLNISSYIDPKDIPDDLPVDKENIPVDPMKLMHFMNVKNVKEEIELTEKSVGLKEVYKVEETKLELEDMEFTCALSEKENVSSTIVVHANLSKTKYETENMSFTMCLPTKFQTPQSVFKSTPFAEPKPLQHLKGSEIELCQSPPHKFVKTGHEESLTIHKTLTTESDMEFTCEKIPVNEPKIIETASHKFSAEGITQGVTFVEEDDMEFTCQIPMKDKRKSTNFEVLLQTEAVESIDTKREVKKYNETAISEFDMEFTCQVPIINKSELENLLQKDNKTSEEPIKEQPATSPLKTKDELTIDTNKEVIRVECVEVAEDKSVIQEDKQGITFIKEDAKSEQHFTCISVESVPTEIKTCGISPNPVENVEETMFDSNKEQIENKQGITFTKEDTKLEPHLPLFGVQSIPQLEVPIETKICGISTKQLENVERPIEEIDSLGNASKKQMEYKEGITFTKEDAKSTACISVERIPALVVAETIQPKDSLGNVLFDMKKEQIKEEIEDFEPMDISMMQDTDLKHNIQSELSTSLVHFLEQSNNAELKTRMARNVENTQEFCGSMNFCNQIEKSTSTKFGIDKPQDKFDETDFQDLSYTKHLMWRRQQPEMSLDNTGFAPIHPDRTLFNQTKPEFSKNGTLNASFDVIPPVLVDEIAADMDNLGFKDASPEMSVLNSDLDKRKTLKRSFSRLPKLIPFTPTKSPCEKRINLNSGQKPSSKKTPVKQTPEVSRCSQNLFKTTPNKSRVKHSPKELLVEEKGLEKLNSFCLFTNPSEQEKTSEEVPIQDLSKFTLLDASGAKLPVAPSCLDKTSHSSFYLGMTTPQLASPEISLDEKQVTNCDLLHKFLPFPSLGPDKDVESELEILTERNRELNEHIITYLETFEVKDIPIPKPSVYELSNASLTDDSEDEMQVERVLSVEEKIRNHFRDSECFWELESVEANDWYHFCVLNRKLKFQAKCLETNGIVTELKSHSELTKKSPPECFFIMKLFLDRFDKSFTKAAIGDPFDILSLLDYVQITMMKLMNFLIYLQQTPIHGFEIDSNFMAKIILLNQPLRVWLEVQMDFNHLDNIEVDHHLKISSRFGGVNVEEIQDLARSCPKGINFLKTFVNSINALLKEKEKKRCAK